MVFVYETPDPLVKFHVFRELLCAIEAAWRPDKSLLFSHILYIFRPTIVLLHTVCGKLLRARAHVLSTTVFDNEEGSILDGPSWRYVEHAVPERILQEFDLDVWRLADLSVGHSYLEKFASLYFFVSWISCLADVPRSAVSDIFDESLNERIHLAQVILSAECILANTQAVRTLFNA